MKSFIRVPLLMAVGVGLALSASAQRSGRKRGAASSAQQNSANDQPQQQVNSSKPPSGYNPYGNIPILKDSTGSSDTIIRKSLRNDDAFDKSFINERTPLPYENLRWDDALFSEKVWRELDLREKMNQPFRYDAQDDNGSQMFVNILLNAVKKGDVVAFQDDRFTTPLTSGDIAQTTSGGAPDTSAVTDVNDPSKVVAYRVTQAAFDPKSVTKLRIKEQWIFDREASRLFVRILGIAPLKTEYFPNSTKERGTNVMFWVYYPDLRPTLAKFEVYNPKNLGYGRMTWEELFESRMFSSYVTRSTLDNPSNKNIRQVVKDPILALLEGDNIKDKIFNYEQDLWSY